MRLNATQRRWLTRLARHGRVALLVAFAAPLIGGLLLIIQAHELSGLLSAAIIDGARRAALATPLLIVAGLIVTRSVLTGLGEFAGAIAAERVKRDLRDVLFRNLMAYKADRVRSLASGAIAGAMIEHVEALDGYVSRYLPSLIAAALLPVAFAVAIMPVDVIVGLLLLATAPLIPLFMALTGWGAQAASRRHLDAFSRLSGLFVDRLRGLTTLKLHGRAQAQAELIKKTGDELGRRILAVLRIAFLSSTVLEFFSALAVAGVALYVGLSLLGSIDLRDSPMTLATGLFCLLMAPAFFAPLRQLAAHYHDGAAAKAAVTALDELFDGLPAFSSAGDAPENAIVHRQGAATLQIRNLTVTAPDRAGTVLDTVSLDAEPGRLIAILGTSGVGKSTLLEAIRGLRTIEAGEVSIDAKPLADFSPHDLARRVAWLGQHPHIMAATIAQNIRLARPRASDEEVARAARDARVSDFADTLPDGLDTCLGERGLGLSGGELQRIALARIYLCDPGLVLLDEPTAHLDPQTEARVIDGIMAFSHGRTVIVATHSARLAACADETFRLSRGHLSPVHARVAKPILREGV